MNTTLRVAAIGVAAIPLLDAVIGVVDDGSQVGVFKIPSILFGLMLAYYLVDGRRWAFVVSAILLSLTVVLFGSATLYIGGTSDLYPTWKIAGCSIITLIGAGSLVCLIVSGRKSGNNHNRAEQAGASDGDNTAI